MESDTVYLTSPVSEFGPNGPDSYVNEYIPIFTLDSGLKDLVGVDTLTWIGANVPMIDYNPAEANGNFLRFDSPNLNVPGYGSFDLKALFGFEIDLGVYLHYQYDFGKLNASATITAPRVDGTKAFGTYYLDTATTTVTTTVNALTGTEPFKVDITIAGSQQDANGVPTNGVLSGGIYDAGVYRDGSPYKGLVFDVAVGALDPVTQQPIADLNAVFDLVGPVLPGETIGSFNTNYLSGYFKVPQLPSLDVTAGGTGTGALDGEGQGSADGPSFANVTFRPINLIPGLGTVNQNSLTIIQSPLVDAGIDYTILGLDISLDALFHQTLDVDIKSVAVHAIASEDISEDVPGSPDRSAIDAADSHPGDGFVVVSEAFGNLGEVLALGNFTEGERTNTKIEEFYSITLSVHNDIDLLLRGGVNFSFLSLSAYINPILLDELRLNIGPLFSTAFSLDLAAINIFDDHFEITFTSAAVIEHTIHTIVEVQGTNGADTKTLVENQIHFDALSGNDSVTGNGIANVIEGGLGNDTLLGMGGDDTLRGGKGGDSLLGGAGNDLLDVSEGTSGTALADGGADNDLIIAGDRQGTFIGGAGNDTITAELSFNQHFFGGSGNDFLSLDASAYLVDFNLDFSAGGNLFTGPFAATYEGFEKVAFLSGMGNDVLLGTVTSDTLGGGGGNDSIDGLNGYDSLTGGDGDDTLSGGSLHDTLRGGAGDDSLRGDSGSDWLYGDAGADTIDGGAGFDLIHGGDGDDSITDPDGGNSIHGDAGDDTISAGGTGSQLWGEAGADSITATSGAVTVDGGTGRDTITALANASGLMQGGLGSDHISVDANGLALVAKGDADVEITLFEPSIDTLEVFNFDTATSPAFMPYFAPVPLAGPVLQLGSSGLLANGTTWQGIEAFSIHGNNAAQYLVAGSQADTLDGKGGNDYLDGGAGRDSLLGGLGNDTLVGSFGDTFIGGQGADLLVFNASGLPTAARGGPVGFELNLGTRRTDPSLPGPIAQLGRDDTRIGTATGGTVVQDIERLMMTGGGGGDDTITGAEFGDTLLGGAGNDLLEGLDGDDELDGGSGSDTVHGGAGNDIIAVTGDDQPPFGEGEQGDYIDGDSGDDFILANRNAAEVHGGSGNDTIIVLDSGASPFSPADRPTIDGGEGSDSIEGSGADEIIIGGVDPIDDPIENADPALVSRAAQLAANDSDTIDGGGGSDSISGGLGRDSLRGGSGNDTITGGSGDDTIDGGADADAISGGSGNDSLGGGAGNDTVQGNAGNDSISGGGQDDLLDGDDGNDTIQGDGGNDTIIGDLGNDSLAGGAGNDSLDGNLGNDSLDGMDGDDLLLGEEGNDSLAGGAGYDSLTGGLGNDSLLGGGDDDTLDGGEGHDSLSGGSGIDSLVGGLGNDSLSGDGDSDLLDGGLGNDSLSGGDGADLLLGGDGADTLSGDAGEDDLQGDLGNDSLSGGGDDDTLTGGAGNDTLAGDMGSDSLDGGLGRDSLIGHDGADSLLGGLDQDTLEGGTGSDLLQGDDGNDLIRDVANDTIPASRGDTLLGGAGNDTIQANTHAESIFGGDGSDVITVFGGGLGLTGGTVSTIAGGAGADMITASDAAEYLRGDGSGGIVMTGLVSTGGGGPVDGGGVVRSPDGNDTIFGNGGDDTIEGGGGADSIDGGDGSDFIMAGLGNDTVYGGNNSDDQGDTIWGDDGNDSLTGSDGLDVISGGAGNDTIDSGLAVSLGGGRDSVDGGSGADSITVHGDALVDGGDGNDRITLGAGGQEVLVRYGTGLTPGSDVVSGFTAGVDTIRFFGAGLSGANMVLTDTVDGLVISFGRASALRVLLTGVLAADLDPGSVLFSGPPAARADLLYVSNDTDAQITPQILLANDLGLGLSLGQIFPQSIFAENAGGGVLLHVTGSPGVFGYLADNSDGSSFALANVEVVPTGNGDDVIVIPASGLGLGTSGSYIDLRDGNDSATGNLGADYFIGGNGHDTLSGNNNADTLLGGAGNDSLIGGNGNDSLDGGSGIDKLEGGYGADSLTGGADADRFVFRNAEAGAIDTITDFAHADADRIDLSLIDANARVLGNQAFIIVAAFSGAAAELVITAGASPGTSTVKGDINGDGLEDFSILVTSDVPLTAADFVL